MWTCGFNRTANRILGYSRCALLAIAFTIVYDVFPVDKHGKMIGLLGAVFGIASVAGPLLDAFITDNFGWGWIFYINVPIGVVVFSPVMMDYKKLLQRMKQKIDWLGAGTLLIAILCLMFAFKMGGNQYARNSVMIFSLFAGFVVFFVNFCYAETKAEESIIPFFLFKGRLFSSAQILAFLYGATFIVLIMYLPIYMQSVYGTTAMGVLMPLFGVVGGSASGGIFLTKTSYRNLMIISVITYFVGMFLLSTLGHASSRSLLTVYMIMVWDSHSHFYRPYRFINEKPDIEVLLTQRIRSCVHLE